MLHQTQISLFTQTTLQSFDDNAFIAMIRNLDQQRGLNPLFNIFIIIFYFFILRLILRPPLLFGSSQDLQGSPAPACELSSCRPVARIRL